MDSLKVLETVLQEDSLIVHVKNMIADKIGDADPKTALQYSEDAFKLASSIDMSYGHAESLMNLGKYFEKLGRKEESLEAFDKAEALAKQEGYQLLLGKIYYKRGVMSFYYGEYDLSLQYHEKAFPLFKDYGTESLLASSHNALGVLNYLDPEKQIYHYGEALRIAKKTGNASLQGMVAMNLGDIYQNRKGDYSSAMAKYEEASTIFDSIGNLRGLATANFRVAAVYTTWEEYGNALKYHEIAYSLRDSLEDKNGLMASSTQIADVYLDLAEPRKALVYCRKAEILGKELGNNMRLGLNYSLMGLAYKNMDILDSARYFGNKAKTLLNEEGSERFAGSNFWMLAEVEELAGNKQKAIALMKKALELAEQTQDTRTIGRYSGSIATLYLSMDKVERAESGVSFYEMENTLLDAIEIANTTKEYDVQHKMYSSAIKLYKEANRNPGRVIAFQDSLLRIKDSLFNQNKAAELGEWATKLETAEKEKAIELLEKQGEIDRQEKALLSARNKLFLVIGIFLALVLAAGAILYGKLRKNKLLIETQKGELEKLNATKDKFFSMIAHDLRSPLAGMNGIGNQIRFYVEKEKTDKLQRLADRTDKTVSSLSKLLDNLLNWALVQKGSIPYQPTQMALLPIAEGVTALFQDTAKVKSLNISLDIDSQVQVFADRASVETVLRNLLSNAIKFTENNGSIQLAATTEAGRTRVKITDSGIGIPLENREAIFDLDLKQRRGTAGEKGTGLGLVLCQELISLNKGSIQADQAPGGGTVFTFDLPIEG